MVARRIARLGYGLVRRSFGRHAVRRALAANPKALLNLGATGRAAPGWVNADVQPVRGTVFLDASRPWPIPSNSIDAILCEHMIEHVTRDGSRILLREAFRTLKPGAPLRIVTPDLQAFARMALEPDGEAATTYRQFLSPDGSASTGEVVNSIFYCYGHKYIYMRNELTEALRDSGFTDVVTGPPDEPVHTVFEGVEVHSAHVGKRVNHIEAFAVEAVKPELPEY
jgi:SAM-dependent methyltransferase